MRILVTGGAGFIGSHIVDSYIANGHDVAVIDNLTTGFRRNLNKRANFYKADIRDDNRVLKIFEKEKPEIVNHHAALASVTESVKNPAETLAVNVTGTANLLAAGLANGLKKFIFASSGGTVYGNTAHIPTPETEKTQPISPYGLSKLFAEQLIQLYGKQHHLPYLIFRYANVYGPRQNPHGEAGVVAIFTETMKRGEQPTIFGDGTKTRDYLYVDDIVDANVRALHHNDSAILNLGRGEEVSDQTVFDTVARSLQYTHPPRYVPIREGEMLKSALDATQAFHTLGWQPATNFGAGVAKTVKAY